MSDFDKYFLMYLLSDRCVFSEVSLSNVDSLVQIADETNKPLMMLNYRSIFNKELSQLKYLIRTIIGEASAFGVNIYLDTNINIIYVTGTMSFRYIKIPVTKNIMKQIVKERLWFSCGKNC